MTRLPKLIILIAAALTISVTLAACGEQKIEVSKSDTSDYRPAELFKQRCAGCHTFKQVGTRGSAANIRTRERTDGPNFNVRHECVERVLYAIQNGGFSGAVMPGNILVGEDAKLVAQFVAKYAGSEAGERPEGTGDSSNGYSCTSVEGDTGPGSDTGGD
ncbi:cytochrome c [Conexibacter sp. CPCC 206217]|uniref:c-type cytochrome n=1 Tax=Conexibacter sp. CPCC 206217 TaxID=3064574 RepID=UPI0027165F10|nr:cytochrome c [Conexibacter sp. CPCC 206217]MDO8211937.1 cytochrome c [Conexibacter sp. CPCC 206217]